MHSPNHLIIVCGHAIWKGGPNNGWDEAEWLIESYKRGETPTFIEHIKAGVTALSKDERAVLVFSGYVRNTSYIYTSAHTTTNCTYPRVRCHIYTSIEKTHIM